MTAIQISRKIEELAAIHPKEIGMRAGEAVVVLKELMKLRIAVAAAADMAGSLAHSLDDGEEGEMNHLQRQASDIHAHLMGSLMT